MLDTVMRFAGLMFNLIFCAHLFACGFGVGRLSVAQGPSGWVEASGSRTSVRVVRWGCLAAALSATDDESRDRGRAMRLVPQPLIRTHLQRWISSTYWAVTTLSTVGYGGIYTTTLSAYSCCS